MKTAGPWHVRMMRPVPTQEHIAVAEECCFLMCRKIREKNRPETLEGTEDEDWERARKVVAGCVEDGKLMKEV